jgi:hypothetical protein
MNGLTAVANISQAKSQRNMLNFQVSQAIKNELLQAEIVDKRRYVVMLSGFIEEALEYIPSHLPYANSAISICQEIENVLDISENDFQEIPDMKLARDLKRISRRGRKAILESLNDDNSRKTEIIIDSLVSGESSEGFEDAWIPDGGELISEIFSMFQGIQSIPSFQVQFIGLLKNKSELDCYGIRISEGGEYWDIAIEDPCTGNNPRERLKKRNNIWLGGKKLAKLNVKQGFMAVAAADFSGEFTLPNGRVYQINYKWGPAKKSPLKSVIIANQDGLNHHFESLNL